MKQKKPTETSQGHRMSQITYDGEVPWNDKVNCWFMAVVGGVNMDQHNEGAALCTQNGMDEWMN